MMKQNQLKIANFKAFVEASLTFKQLTVLAGANANGKSSALQALLLLRRSWELHERHNGSRTEVPLNDLYGNHLGTDSAVWNKRATGPLIELTVGQDETVEWGVTFEGESEHPRLALKPTLTIAQSPQADGLSKALQQSSFYYLTAERVGPRVRNQLLVTEYPHAGWTGETTAQVLDMDGGFYKIAENRKFPGSNILNIIDQANDWLNFIFPGTRVKVSQHRETLSTQILLENEMTRNEPSLATNLGFGLSYVLPIIANGLIAAPNTLFIVENPEAHLHPSAQYRIGQFLSMVAATGTMVVVETHSDHLLNGIQLAVAGQSIGTDQVVVNFFDIDKERRQPKVTTIYMDQKGQLSSWPKGFFDQTQIAFAELHKKRNNL